MRKARGISSSAWAAIRWQVLERDNWTCQTTAGGCGRIGGRFEVHHLDGNPRNNAMDNLAVLCRDCHFAKHFAPKPAGYDDWTAYLGKLLT